MTTYTLTINSDDPKTIQKVIDLLNTSKPVKTPKTIKTNSDPYEPVPFTPHHLRKPETEPALAKITRGMTVGSTKEISPYNPLHRYHKNGRVNRAAIQKFFDQIPKNGGGRFEVRCQFNMASVRMLSHTPE